MHHRLHRSLHSSKTLEVAWRILKPGGRIVAMDLLRHGLEEARELYADVWLGFSQVELMGLLRAARFQQIEVAVVHREPEAPHFETLLAMAEKPRKRRGLAWERRSPDRLRPAHISAVGSCW